MNLRIVVFVWMCFLGPGVAVDAAGPIDVYRENAAFDPDGRHFMLWGLPSMVTRIHSQLVEEFIQRPGAGIGRVEPRFAPTVWVELIPESLADHRVGSDGGKTQPPKYDAINETMTLPDGTKRTVRERVWLLRKQQLVRVNSEAGPAVYVQDAKAEHDRMKEKKAATSKNTPTRKPDEFETAALAQLREGNDVVMQSSADSLRVLGAIRAREHCMECHTVKVGDMLGAFSYKLQLQSEATQPADCLKDTAGLSLADLGAVHVVESLGGKVVRTPGGPITEVYFTHTWNQGAKNNAKGKSSPYYMDSASTHVCLKNSSLQVLGAFPELRTLDVSNSMVTDDGLKEIAKLKKLRKLCFTQGYLTDAGIAELKKELPQCEMENKSAALGPVVP